MIAPNFSDSAVRSMIYHSWTLIRSIHLAAPKDGIALKKVKGEVQTRKGLRWIPRHPETRKGVASDEMLRGVENKHRSGDSQIGQPFELPAESMSRQETTWRTETS